MDDPRPPAQRAAAPAAGHARHTDMHTHMHTHAHIHTLTLTLTLLQDMFGSGCSAKLAAMGQESSELRQVMQAEVLAPFMQVPLTPFMPVSLVPEHAVVRDHRHGCVCLAGKCVVQLLRRLSELWAARPLARLASTPNACMLPDSGPLACIQVYSGAKCCVRPATGWGSQPSATVQWASCSPECDLGVRWDCSLSRCHPLP